MNSEVRAGILGGAQLAASLSALTMALVPKYGSDSLCWESVTSFLELSEQQGTEQKKKKERKKTCIWVCIRVAFHPAIKIIWSHKLPEHYQKLKECNCENVVVDFDAFLWRLMDDRMKSGEERNDT